MEDPKSAAIRLSAFDWLTQKASLTEDVFDRNDLKQGLIYEGRRVPLLGPQGIFKPAEIVYYPISITTSPNSPYLDDLKDGSIIEYKYRGNDPHFHENVRLKRAMIDKVPLIYFFGLIPNKYVAQYPVYIVGANDRTLTFTVDIEVSTNTIWDQLNHERVNDKAVDEIRKLYSKQEVITRIHQRAFREKVLYAYKEHCAICRLKHRELLDAAHIIPDSEGGSANVNNGISLCKIHHTAFDKNIIGINEDYRIEVRHDILEEVDGPMLRYGIQEMHHQEIILPTKKIMRPGKEFIRDRYERFLSV